MAVPQKAVPLPVTNDSEEVRPSRNPVGLQVSKPDPPSRNLVRDTNQPFQGLTSNSTPPQGSEDAEPLSHNYEREHQEAIQHWQQKVSDFEIRMHKFDENMKELKETMKKLKEELHVKEVEEDRRVSKLKSKVAALEKRITPDGGTEISESWETFKSNLYNLFKKLRPDVTIEPDNIDSGLIQQFKVLHRLYTRMPEREETCKNLQGLLGDFDFDCVVSQVLFFLIANQVYNINGECDICPLCGIKKKSSRNNEKLEEGDPNSHIFPKSLLEVYREVHCEGKGDFIWDMALSDKYGAEKLTVKLLCQKCELSASCAERKLRDLYVDILSHPNERIEVPNEGEWLSFVLANIMFRGLVINVNLMNEICSGRIGSVEALLDLRRYCKEPESKNLPSLYLSVLPNGPFKPELGGVTYMFDLQLRNPEFTSIVDMEEGTFLYTKFDCFHCMLPLVDRSLGFETVLDCGKKTIPSEEERCCLFPKVLLRRNLDEAAELFQYIISQPDSRLNGCCRVFISLVRSICHRSETIQWPTKGVQLYSATSYCQFKALEKRERAQKIEEAAQASPLKVIRIGSSPLRQENIQLRKLQSEFERQKNQLKEERKNVEKYRSKVADLERERDEKLAQKEQECCRLKAELERKDAELERKDTELEKKDAELQLEKLKCQPNIVTPIQEEAQEDLCNSLATHEITPEESST